MSVSNGERKVAALLDSGDIIYEQEFIFPELKSSKGNPLRFDFAIFEDLQSKMARQPKFLLEYNGEQHYAQKFQTSHQFAEQQANDKRKRNFCRVKGYTLVEIPYTDYNSITLDSILEQGKFFD